MVRDSEVDDASALVSEKHQDFRGRRVVDHLGAGRLDRGMRPRARWSRSERYAKHIWMLGIQLGA